MMGKPGDEPKYVPRLELGKNQREGSWKEMGHKLGYGPWGYTKLVAEKGKSQSHTSKGFFT